jgi:hypothetical protein
MDSISSDISTFLANKELKSATGEDVPIMTAFETKGEVDEIRGQYNCQAQVMDL